MQSTVTARGQTVIPAEIRRRFRLSPGDRLEWIVEEGIIHVIPVSADPIATFRGQGRGGNVTQLLTERAQDQLRE
jgi:AbrB family looped-hinge helix DNA binding protein